MTIGSKEFGECSGEVILNEGCDNVLVTIRDDKIVIGMGD